MDPLALELAKEATIRAKEIAALQASDGVHDDSSAPLTEHEKAEAEAEAEAVRKKAIGQVRSALQVVRAQLAEIETKVNEIFVLLLWSIPADAV